MAVRLVALDEGPDISLDRSHGPVIVGRHPQCDARLDSIRVSRRHCCMTEDNGEVVVRDLGSTNGIRINGQRVEVGRLRAGDELSIAHIRFRVEDGLGQQATLLESMGHDEDGHHHPFQVRPVHLADPKLADLQPQVPDNPLAAAVRNLLPAGMADRCRIQVIVQMQPPDQGAAAEAAPKSDPALEQEPQACPQDSSP